MKKTFFVTIMLCCSLFLLASCSNEPAGLKLLKPVPDFSLVDRQGKTWTLSQLKGQVVFINFWATWCNPCREEMPAMQRLHEKMPKDSFKMLAILNSDDPALADRFAEKLGITIPILDDQTNVIGPQYGITGVPETFIVNKKGILVRKFIGPADWDSTAIEQMLTGFIEQ